MEDSLRYEVVEAHGFLGRAIAVLNGDLWAWEEIKVALDFALARDPKAFQEIGDSNLYAVQITTLPPHAVYFTVDDWTMKVCLEEIV